MVQYNIDKTVGVFYPVSTKDVIFKLFKQQCDEASFCNLNKFAVYLVLLTHLFSFLEKILRLYSSVIKFPPFSDRTHSLYRLLKTEL